MTPATRNSNRIEHQIGHRGRVVIRHASGELRVRGVEGDQVRVTMDDDRAIDDIFTVDAGDGYLDLRQNTRLGFGIFGRGEDVDLDVEAPHGATISIDGQSVDIDASDLSGSKTFRTASGDVALHRLAGAVEVETVSGDIGVDGNAPLDVRAKTVSGDIEIRVPQVKRLDLGTTSGDAVLDAELRGDGPFAMRTISGDVTVVGRSGFRVEAESITGDISSELPAKRESQPGRKILVVGRPGPTLTFRSVSGDFLVVEPRQAAQSLEEVTMLDDDRTTSTTHAATAGLAEPAGGHARPEPEGDADARRLDILRRLERGEIDVARAGDLLGELDEVAR